MQASSNPLGPAITARRAKKYLDEFEVIVSQSTVTGSRSGTDPPRLPLRPRRSNHTEVNIDPDQIDGTTEGSGCRRRRTARQTLLPMNKRPLVHPNKGSAMGVGTALLYKKNLATLIEESVSSIGSFCGKCKFPARRASGTCPHPCQAIILPLAHLQRNSRACSVPSAATGASTVT